MKLGFSATEEEFRRECADWLNGQMAGEFKDIKGITTLTEKAERRKYNTLQARSSACGHTCDL